MSKTPLDGELAGDGIDEFLSAMLPRQVKNHPDAWTGKSLHLHRTDGEGEWTVRLGPDGEVSTDPTRARKGRRCPSSAQASSLYLWILNRVPVDELELYGDPAVAGLWTSEISL